MPSGHGERLLPSQVFILELTLRSCSLALGSLNPFGLNGSGDRPLSATQIVAFELRGFVATLNSVYVCV